MHKQDSLLQKTRKLDPGRNKSLSMAFTQKEVDSRFTIVKGARVR